MHIAINGIETCIDIADCMTAEETREVTLDNEHLNALAELVLCGWSSTKPRYKKSYNPFGHSGMR